MNKEWIPASGVLRQLLPFLAVFCLFGVFAFSTIEGVVTRWLKLDESYSHGFLLLAVSLFLTVQAVKRHPVVSGFYPFWLLPFALCLLGYWLGGLIRLQALQQLTLVPMLLSGFAVVMGWRQIRWFLIPLGLLFLTVPVWDFLAWNLQLITVAVNKFLLGFLDINFEIEGVFVYLVG
ncbi:archaeosortase/exosortase family protein, partial [Marinobacter sp.]|uniref:archaeosortase/exosortase family protein n=1 Tax=Marinobacter sp. TaxID=50741 RepID=UPI00356279D8